MIGHHPHPTEPGNARAVTFHKKGPPLWASLPGFHSDGSSASRASADAVRESFKHLARRVRCGHPGADRSDRQGMDSKSAGTGGREGGGKWA